MKRSALCFVALIVVAGCTSGPSPSAPTSTSSDAAVASAVASPNLEARLDQLLVDLGMNGAALVAQDGRVTHLAVEAPGGFDVSRAEAVIAAL